MVRRRVDADARARDAIDLIQRRLVEALGGEPLRGMPDLGDHIYGMRVGHDVATGARLPRDRAVLVLESRGLLVMAMLYGRAGFVQKAPRGVIRASDLDPYVRVVSLALAEHLRLVETRGEEFLRVSALSDKITLLL